MRTVARSAAFHLHRCVLVQEWSALFGVATDAHFEVDLFQQRTIHSSVRFVAVGAFDLRFSANAGPPLVITCRSVTFLTGLWVLPQFWIDGAPGAKQIKKEGEAANKT